MAKTIEQYIDGIRNPEGYLSIQHGEVANLFDLIYNFLKVSGIAYECVGTTTKTATIPDIESKEDLKGKTICFLMKSTNTSAGSFTLDVNGLGADGVRYYVKGTGVIQSSIPPYTFIAGSYVFLTHNGTYWMLNGILPQTSDDINTNDKNILATTALTANLYRVLSSRNYPSFFLTHSFTRDEYIWDLMSQYIGLLGDYVFNLMCVNSTTAPYNIIFPTSTANRIHIKDRDSMILQPQTCIEVSYIYDLYTKTVYWAIGKEYSLT